MIIDKDMTKLIDYIARCTFCKQLSNFVSTNVCAMGDTTIYYCERCGRKEVKIVAINSKHNDIMKKIYKILPNARTSLHYTDLDKIIIQLNPSELGIQD